jgi:hypothetical protein
VTPEFASGQPLRLAPMSAHISLDGWRAYAGLLVSIAIIVVGMVLVARPQTAD